MRDDHLAFLAAQRQGSVTVLRFQTGARMASRDDGAGLGVAARVSAAAEHRAEILPVKDAARGQGVAGHGAIVRCFSEDL